MSAAFELPPGSEGVLPIQWLRPAVDRGVIDVRASVPDKSFQPASLDLRLGEKAHRLRASFLPDRDAVQDKLADYALGQEIDLRDGAILERNRPYLIPLQEALRLPGNVHARTNPKSSTGRLDIFTRVITDRGPRFDEIGAGYSGKLYLEIVSRTFLIQVKTGLSLNQLRLFAGRPRCSDEEIVESHRGSPLLFYGSQPVAGEDLLVVDGLFLSLDLSGGRDAVVGYKAKKNSKLLDLSGIGQHDPAEFWERLTVEEKNRIVLEPEEFYLLLSAERVRIPPQYAAEMVAFDPTSGELRTHYAGFFDPGFGYDRQGLLTGTKAVMEVRAHDVPFAVEHLQKVSRLSFERMLECPDRLYGAEVGSSYQEQELTLSKHFRSPRTTEPGQRSMFSP